MLIEHEVAHAIEALVGLPFPALLTLNLGGMVLVLAPVTLYEIVLAHALTGRSIEPAPRLNPTNAPGQPDARWA